MRRSCARPGCSVVARATLTYVCEDRLVWLEGPLTERHPMSHALCDPHADALRVPQGWSLEDRRGAAASSSQSAIAS